MKCKVCGEKAVIKLRQHNLALCEEHFIERFRREVERTLKKYEMFDRGQPVLVAVSGGKDSLSLLHVLKSLDYKVTGLFIDLGIEGMSEKARAKVEELAARLDVELVVVSLKDKYGESLPEIAKRRPQHRICSLWNRRQKAHTSREVGIPQILHSLSGGIPVSISLRYLFLND